MSSPSEKISQLKIDRNAPVPEIKIIGYPLTVLMAIGAVFGALNSMYSSLSNNPRS